MQYAATNRTAFKTLGPTASKYLFFEVGRYFFTTLVIFLSILVAARLVKLASLIITKGAAFGKLALFIITIIPTFLEVALPLAILIGVMMAIGRLSLDSELIAMKANGIPLLALVKPILLVASLVMLFGVLNGVYVRPWAYSAMSRLLVSAASERAVAAITEGVFNNFGDNTIYVDKIDRSTGVVERVILDMPAEQQIIFASRGSIRPVSGTNDLLLSLEDGESHIASATGYNLTHFAKSDTLLANPLNTETRKFRARELKFSEIVSRLADEPERKEYVGLALELSRRFALPVACLLLAPLALALGIFAPRGATAWANFIAFVTAIVITILYYGLLSIMSAIANSTTINPFFAMWVPNILLLGILLPVLRIKLRA